MSEILKRGFTLIELLVVIAISLTVMSTALVGYRKFSERRALTDSLKAVKDQLRLIRTKAIHGEKPTSVGIPPDLCVQLLYYEVDIEIVDGGNDKLVWTPVCQKGDGVKENGVQEEYEIETGDIDPDSDGYWPINIAALQGTANQEAILTISYKGDEGFVTVNESGNIQ